MADDELKLEKAGPWEVGENGVVRIVLRRDGAGPMGWYDMIYVYTERDEFPWLSMPAHLTDFWQR
jgi:hypothetical protein